MAPIAESKDWKTEKTTIRVEAHAWMLQKLAIEDAAKKFKLLFQRERVVGQLKEKASYEKPSAKKRRKRREAHGRRLMAAMRERLMQSGEWDRRQKQKQQKRQRRTEDRIRKQDSPTYLDDSSNGKS